MFINTINILGESNMTKNNNSNIEQEQIEKRREYGRRSYHKNKEKNRDKHREQNKTSYQKNKDKRKAYRKEYYLNNREKVLADTKRYKEENKEKVLEYRENNKEQEYERQKEYRKKHSVIPDGEDCSPFRKRSRARESTFKGTITKFFAIIRGRAKKNGYISNIDKDYLVQLLNDALINLGDLISLEVLSPRRASIDQIIPGNGYYKGNVHIIPAWLNYAYLDYDKDEVNEQIVKFSEYVKLLPLKK